MSQIVSLVHYAPYANMATMAEDLLGGGLDIDGWSYLKQDREHNRCADLIDKTYLGRQQGCVQQSRLSSQYAFRCYNLPQQLKTQKKCTSCKCTSIWRCS